jgi:hypothetical protein
MPDPFARAAERIAHARPMTLVERHTFFTAAARWKGPRLIAYKGFDPRPFHSLPVYYLDDASGNYVDTLDGTIFEPAGE